MTLKEVADLIGVKYWRLEYALRTGRIKVRKEYRCQNGRWTRHWQETENHFTDTSRETQNPAWVAGLVRFWRLEMRHTSDKGIIEWFRKKHKGKTSTAM